jgi:hypothetical protein
MTQWAPYAAAAVCALAMILLGWTVRRGAAGDRAALDARLSDIDAQLQRLANAPPALPDLSAADDLAAGMRDDLSIMFTYVGKLAGIMGAEADRVIDRVEALEETLSAPPVAEPEPEFEPEESAEPDDAEPDDAEAADPDIPPDIPAGPDIASLVAEAREALEGRLEAMDAAAQARHGAFRVLVESRIETLREMLGDIEAQIAGNEGAGAPDAALAALAQAQRTGFAALEAEQARLHEALSDAALSPPPTDDLRVELAAIADALAALRAIDPEADADLDADPAADPIADLSALLARRAEDAAAIAAERAEVIDARLDALALRLDRAPDDAPAADAVLAALDGRFAALEARIDALAAGFDGQAGAVADLSTALAPDRLALLLDQRAERDESAARIARRIVDIAPAATSGS